MEASRRNVEFVDKLATFTVEDLKHTVKESEIGSTKSKVFHYDFINDISEILDKRNMRFTIQPIYVREGGRSDMPNITRIVNIAKNYNVENPLESQLIRNLTGKIVINELTDEFTGPMIAFSLNQLGQQIAFGANVWVCSNGCIFGPNIIQTYGSSKLSMRDMMYRLGEWMDSFDKKRSEDVRFISLMQGAQADHSHMPALIGDLLIRATKANILKKEDEAPLNVSQVSDFAKSFVQKEAKIDNVSIETVWDVYNVGTRLLNPDMMRNYETTFRQNRAFGEFILEKYGLDKIQEAVVVN